MAVGHHNLSEVSRVLVRGAALALTPTYLGRLYRAARHVLVFMLAHRRAAVQPLFTQSAAFHCLVAFSAKRHSLCKDVVLHSARGDGRTHIPRAATRALCSVPITRGTRDHVVPCLPACFKLMHANPVPVCVHTHFHSQLSKTMVVVLVMDVNESDEQQNGIVRRTHTHLMI
eukprot:scaffold305659_cov39-Tisochrysis_lutea.AAC.1